MMAADRERAFHSVVLVAAATCFVVGLLMPHWESVLHAQGYGKPPETLSAITPEALQNTVLAQEKVNKHVENIRQSRRVQQFASLCPEALMKPCEQRKWGVFLAFDRATLKRRTGDVSSGPNDFDDEINGGIGGLDYRLSRNLLAGLAVTLGFGEQQFDDLPSLPDNPTEVGSRRSLTVMTGPYLAYLPDRHWYGAMTFLAGHVDARTRRSGSGLRDVARASVDGISLSTSAGGGYEWQYDALGFGPMLNVEYNRVEMDGYTERGRVPGDLLRAESTADDLFTLRAGLRSLYLLQVGSIVVVPSARLLYVFRDSFETEPIRLFTVSGAPLEPVERETPDPASLEMGLGLQFVLTEDLTLWMDYRETFLEDQLQRTGLTAGIRKQF